MDLSLFSALVNTAQHVYQSTRALLELKVDAETAVRINALLTEVGDLTGKVIEAHTAHWQCQEKAMQLEKEIRRLKDFEAESQRYALKEIAPGALAYQLRADRQGEEPVHYLCAACYAQHNKSILQFARYDGRLQVLACPSGHEIKTPHGFDMACQTAPGRFDDNGF